MSDPVDKATLERRDDTTSQKGRDAASAAAAATTTGDGATTVSMEQFMQMKQELQRKGEELQRKGEELQRKGEENDALKKEMSNFPTMGKTYQQTTVNGRKRKYAVPGIKLNDQVEPHTTKRGSGTKGNKEEKEIRDKKIKAEFVSVDAWNDVDCVTIPTKLRTNTDERAHPLASVLGTKADDGSGAMKIFEYQNEACVQDLVKAQVEDMVKCLGLGAILKVHVEMSIFSGVPDVVVVSSKDTPLLFVEVKSPERQEGEVFTANDVGIQVWNYLMGFKKMGHEIPVACLSTYNKLAIITAEDLTEHPDHKAFLSVMQSKLSTETSTYVPKDDVQVPCEEDNTTPSPTKPTVKLIDLPKNEAGEEDRDEKPKIFMSKVFCDGEVLQALLAALLASHHHNKDNKDNEKLQVVQQGDELSGLFSPKVSAEGMAWTTIRKGVNANYNGFPRADAGEFYLLARIGQGSCGKVYLASTKDGTMCALKLYVPRRSNLYSNTEREKEDQKNLEAKAAVRDREMQRWGALYPELKNQAKEINGLPALLMVYGSQLNRSERKTRLQEVKKELQRFAKEGFAYKKSDLRWRHVVLYNGGILLVDLESLEDISSLDDIGKAQHVEKQFLRIEGRIGDDESAELVDGLY